MGRCRMLENGSGSTAQAFIYKVPDDFTLRTEEGEDPRDVAPVQKLTGHSRYGQVWLDITRSLKGIQEGRTRPLQSSR